MAANGWELIGIRVCRRWGMDVRNDATRRVQDGGGRCLSLSHSLLLFSSLARWFLFGPSRTVSSRAGPITNLEKENNFFNQNYDIRPQ